MISVCRLCRAYLLSLLYDGAGFVTLYCLGPRFAGL